MALRGRSFPNWAPRASATHQAIMRLDLLALGGPDSRVMARRSRYPGAIQGRRGILASSHPSLISHRNLDGAGTTFSAAGSCIRAMRNRVPAPICVGGEVG